MDLTSYVTPWLDDCGLVYVRLFLSLCFSQEWAFSFRNRGETGRFKIRFFLDLHIRRQSLWKKKSVLIGNHRDIELFKNGLFKQNKNVHCVNFVHQGPKGRCPYAVSRSCAPYSAAVLRGRIAKCLKSFRLHSWEWKT
jgi:hypothetical protein